MRPTKDLMREAESRGVGCGMVIAAAIIVRVWGDEVQALEILGAAGARSMADLRAWGCDAYDVWPLRGVLRSLWRRKQPMDLKRTLASLRP